MFDQSQLLKGKNGGKRGGVKQLVYQIPVRWSDMDSDYIVYSGYRAKWQGRDSGFIATDVGVDFAEDKLYKYNDQRRLPPVPKIRKVHSRQQQRQDADDNFDFNMTRNKFEGKMEHDHCKSWRRGDKVVISETNQVVEILERGLKGKELVVKIQYLDKNDNPGLVVELSLIELMIIGNLAKTRRDIDNPQEMKQACGNGNTNKNVGRWRLPSPQPNYYKYSKPKRPVNSGLHQCLAQRFIVKSPDTVDAINCDAPRFHPVTRPWYSNQPKMADPPLSATKLIGDPDDFQRKRLFFENFFVATETGLKPKPFEQPPVIVRLDDNSDLEEETVNELYLTAISFPEDAEDKSQTEQELESQNVPLGNCSDSGEKAKISSQDDEEEPANELSLTAISFSEDAEDKGQTTQELESQNIPLGNCSDAGEKVKISSQDEEDVTVNNLYLSAISCPEDAEDKSQTEQELDSQNVPLENCSDSGEKVKISSQDEADETVNNLYLSAISCPEDAEDKSQTEQELDSQNVPLVNCSDSGEKVKISSQDDDEEDDGDGEIESSNQDGTFIKETA